ncbi:hypothetical protein FQ187_11785 [Pseudomonas sp. ANT_J28]|nr:hypothetical protein FQ187_11785 [Pseudomonas sp. ANT_J28]
MLSPVAFWYVATPWVSIHFSDKGKGPLGFVLNTQDEIYRGDINPGEVTGGPGHIFPNDDFFMQFDWTNAGHNHCFSVKPKWPRTHIYIGADGVIDKSPGSGTDVDRLVPCMGEK